MSNQFGSTSSSAGSPYSGTSGTTGTGTDGSSPATSTSPASHSNSNPYIQSQSQQYQTSPRQQSYQYQQLSQHPLAQSPVQGTSAFPSTFGQGQGAGSGAQGSGQLDSYTQALQIQAQQQAMAAMRNRSISPPRKVTSEEMAMTLGWGAIGGIEQLLGQQGPGLSTDFGSVIPPMQMAQGGMGSPVQSTIGLQQQHQHQAQHLQQQQRQSLSPQIPLHHVPPSAAPLPSSQQQQQPVHPSAPAARPAASPSLGSAGGTPVNGSMHGNVGQRQATGQVNGQGMGLGIGVGVGAGVGAGMSHFTVKQEVKQEPMSPPRQVMASTSTSPTQPPPARMVQAAYVPSPNGLPPSRPTTSAAPSRATSLGMDGPSAAPTPSASDKPLVQSRSEPPKRLIDIDFLPFSDATVNELKSTASRNRLLLQGDPQIIQKQRVETAIRVILDILRSIPAPLNAPALPAALVSALPPDPIGANLFFERPIAFKGLVLQAGTTTKAIAKKQLQAGKTAQDELLFLETAVYMSGEHGKRVYACKRCRLREERRRANKDAARKKQIAPPPSATALASAMASAPGANGISGQGIMGDAASNGSTVNPLSIAPPLRMPGAPPPSVDYITGVNAEQYDPHNKTQVVEEPQWDPTRADWRHEIVLFNSSPEVPVKDGSCFWLPFRVICYGKCHGEKVGFRIKFTLRAADGTVVATSFTDPIRITDDHKTDTKAKPKVEGMTSTAQPPVPRGRKSRATASAASSRRQSPAPSEAESVQSISEAGAVLQKQTPNVRTKPYERPPSQSPASAMQGLTEGPDRPRIARQQSSSSVHSLSALSLSNANNGHGMDLYTQDIKPFDQALMSNTVSPGALRRPNFGFTSLDGLGQNYTPSAPHSAASSSFASPITGTQSLSDDMFTLPSNLNGIAPALGGGFGDMSALTAGPNGQLNMGYGAPSVGNQMLSDYLVDQADQDMSNTLMSSMSGMFDSSSTAPSIASSFNDAASNSAFSAFQDGASGYYSDSGLVPDDASMEMENFLDFSGGQDQSLNGPPFGGSAQSPFGLDIDGMSPDPISTGSQADSPANGMLGFGSGSQNEIQDILSSLNQRRYEQNSSPSMGMLHHPLSPVASMASPAAFTGGMGVSMGGFGSPAAMGMMGTGGYVHNNDLNNGFAPANHQAQQQQQQVQQAQMQMQEPIPPQPLVSHVIPAEGPMAGGTQVAVAGQRFAPGMTVLFGTRMAKTTVISDGFCTCELPPAAEAGLVEISVQGAIRRPGDKVETFRYLGMDKEMMRLALEVRDQYQNSSSAAAYRLAQRVAQSSGSASNSESERSSASPMGSGASPNMFAAAPGATTGPSDTVEPKEEEDLQLTIINFLSSLDKHAPGSFRRSGCVNHRNSAQQTLLHLAVVMGFHRLVRRLILMGALLDLQDVHGFTALAFASLCGQAACARVLIEAGASYDLSTAFGEMPLDLAKLGDRAEVEALLLSAVWSTTATAAPTPAPEAKLAISEDKGADPGAKAVPAAIPHLPSEAKSEIDDDNPSSSSEVDEEASRLRSFKVRRRKSKGKSKAISPALPLASSDARQQAGVSAAQLSPSTVSIDLATAASVPLPLDDPPPYEPSRAPSPQMPTQPSHPQGPTWMERTVSNISDAGAKFDSGMWSRLPLPSFWTDKAQSALSGTRTDSEARQHPHGWIALPAPSWETLSKLTSPEEVKLFTQAMAAAALSAVVQSTGGTLDFGESSTSAQRGAAVAQRRRKTGLSGARRSSQSSSSLTPTATGNVSGAGEAGDVGNGGARKAKLRRSSRREKGSEGEKEKEQVKNMVKHVKQDRMLYLFWLPILLFVGFWLLVTALPIATGFGLIYARQITKAIKQRM